MQKVIKIIFVIIIIVAIVLVGAWIFSRKRAVQDGQPAPSFRAFLGLGEKTIPEGTSDGSLSSDFTTPESPSEGETPGTPTTSQSPSVSTFTDEPLTLSNPPLFSGGTSGSGGFGGGNITGDITTDPGVGSGGGAITPTGPAVTVTQGNGCSEADVNIAFTAEEIARLKELQNRFYAIAGNLQSDSAVSSELANYTTFKTKGDVLNELYTYCAQKAPLIATPAYTTRTATPFWRNAAKDREGYMPIVLPQLSGPFANIFTDTSNIDPRNVKSTQVIMQRIFKLNLW